MPGVDELLTGTALADRAGTMLRLPLATALDVRLLDAADPAAGVWFEVAPGIADNGAGGVHAAVLGAVLEMSAYLALLPQLRGDEHAVSHAVSTQLLGPARHGERVEVRATADTRTGRLGFVSAAAAGPRASSPGPRSRSRSSASPASPREASAPGAAGRAAQPGHEHPLHEGEDPVGPRGPFRLGPGGVGVEPGRLHGRGDGRVDRFRCGGVREGHAVSSSGDGAALLRPGTGQPGGRPIVHAVTSRRATCQHAGSG